jgi:hypothetical protein
LGVDGVIDFWELIKASDPDPSGYFDDVIHRAVEMECAMPRDSVAWVHSRWPGIEVYLYDTSEDTELPTRFEKLGKVIVIRRPEDHGQEMKVDWVAHIVERGT